MPKKAPLVVPPDVKLLTVPEFAAETRMSVSTIRSWIAQRKVEFVKLGGRVLFTRTYLDAFISSRTVREASAR